MSKKREDKEKSIDNIINESFGNDIICGADCIVSTPHKLISVSPKLDLALGGGIADGSIVVLTGPPKIGKTILGLTILAHCQAKDMPCYIVNAEGRLKERDIKGIKGLDIDRLKIIESKPGKILKAHEYLSAVEKVINLVPNSAVLIDSFSALCTEAEMTGGMDEMQRADGPKLLAKFFRKVANVVPVNRNILLGITHIMANPTGYGAATKDKGGYALTYQLDYKLIAKKMEAIKTSNGTQIGQEVEWQVGCSGLGPPGSSTVSYIKYGIGIDILRELLDLACDVGLVEKGASWYTIKFGKHKDQKVQGMDNLADIFKDDYTELDNEIRKILFV